MPTVKLDRNTIYKKIGKKLNDDQLFDRISYLGQSLEDIQKDEITVEINPNRPDLLSEQGFARALGSFIGTKKGLKKYTVKKSSVKVIIHPSVKKVRPCTACAIVKGLKLNDELIKEIIYLQEKLHITYGRNRKKTAIGIYPLEHISPPITFIAKKPQEIKFAPLELSKELTGSQILSMHPTGRAYGHLLDGCSVYPVFVDAKQNVMSMPPIINSNKVGKITTKTKDVFIECSGFDYDYLSVCLNMIVTSLADMGGDIYSVEIKDKKTVVSPNLDPREMKISLEKVNSLLGVQFSEADLKKYLELMGFGYAAKKVLVPCYRADIMHEVDLIEDIAIAYGYEQFKEDIPTRGAMGEEHPLTKYESKMRSLLIGHRLIEACNVHLSNEKVQNRQVREHANLIQLKNSLSEDYAVLRRSLIPGLLETLQRNKLHDYPQNLFELGTVFEQDKSTETGVAEKLALGIVLCNKSADFTKMKQVVDALLHGLGLVYDVAEENKEVFIKGRSCGILVSGKHVGSMGEVAPAVLELFQLEMPTVVTELFVEGLIQK
ncbi:MAG: phenylalanine--tRNA ligase subunit beta [archaeon]